MNNFDPITIINNIATLNGIFGHPSCVVPLKLLLKSCVDTNQGRSTQTKSEYGFVG